jgi:hypothetical protein
MSSDEKSKLMGQLALEAASNGIPKLFDKVRKLMKDKKITLDKVLRIYAVVQAAMKAIEAIASEK